MENRRRGRPCWNGRDWNRALAVADSEFVLLDPHALKHRTMPDWRTRDHQLQFGAVIKTHRPGNRNANRLGRGFYTCQSSEFDRVATNFHCLAITFLYPDARLECTEGTDHP